jgi:hypothetical protein
MLFEYAELTRWNVEPRLAGAEAILRVPQPPHSGPPAI